MRRNGLVAAVLSGLIPGLGQGYLGRVRRGFVFAAPLLLLGVLSIGVLDLDTIEIVGLAVRPVVLKSLLIVNLAIAIWRVAAVTDAFSLSETRTSWWSMSVVALVIVAVVAPHVVVTQYTLDAAHALDEVFVAEGDEYEPIVIEPEDLYVDDEVLPPPPDPKLTVTRYPGREPQSLLFTPGIGDPDAVAAAPRYDTTGDPVERFGEDAEGVDRITILLVGGDGGPGRSGSRADSIMVGTLDTSTGKAAIFGIPRNMTHVPLPDEWSTPSASSTRAPERRRSSGSRGT